MKCSSVEFSRHAMERMFHRKISPEAVTHVIETGEVIKVYPDDEPYPSALVLGFWENEPIHVVVAREEHSRKCYVVTAYRPDSKTWGDDYKTRRQP